MGLWVFKLPISLVMIERIYILSHDHHHQIGSMNYHPSFRIRSWNNGMRCMSLYILFEVNEASKHHLTHCCVDLSLHNVIVICPSGHMGLPMSQNLSNRATLWWIYTIRNSMESSRPVVVQHCNYLTLTLDFQGQILKMLYIRNGRGERLTWNERNISR